jgi:hypothetical protein
MATAFARSLPAPQAFQFRLATLLIAMAWAGFVSLGLRTPTALWSGIIAILTLLTVLVAVLIAIYRVGRTRAMAIGFLVFCLGYLTYLTTMAGNLGNGLGDESTPIGGIFSLAFQRVHPAHEVELSFGTATVTTMDAAFEPRHFLAICNQAIASGLGVVGAIVAQILYATQRHEATATCK